MTIDSRQREMWERLDGISHSGTGFLAAPDCLGKVVLVTGAGGSIGSALARHIALSHPRRMILLDISERNLNEVEAELSETAPTIPPVPILGDICDQELVNEIFSCYQPDVVLHTAALKHVPLMEKNPLAAVRTNVFGTATLARAAAQSGTSQLVMVSTDKAVVPASIMGVSKRLAELVLLRSATAETLMKCVRLGNVLGSDGSVGPLLLRQIREGGPLTVTHPEAERYFFTMSQAVSLILEASTLAQSGILIPAVIPKPLRVLELAGALIQQENLEHGNLQITFTGLRPGEKLSETFTFATETVRPTQIPGLFSISGPVPDPAQLDSASQKLCEAICQRDTNLLLRALCSVVPEYKPSDTLRKLAGWSSSSIDNP